MGMAAAFSDENRTGPPINKLLTEMATKRLGKKLTQEKMLNVAAKYDPPEICTAMIIPRVSPKMRQFLNAFTRKSDIRLANLQQTLQKATFATLVNSDKLLAIDANSTTKKEMLANSFDIVAMLGHVASQCVRSRSLLFGGNN